ncbi:hypothetical protein COOONC_27689 [Cooperia oncophora]
MSSSATNATPRELRTLFARFENPRITVSDNRTQFTSREFQDFCARQGIQHVQSSTQIERERKVGDTEFLKCYRRAPSTSTSGQVSPAELFLGHQIRTNLTLLNET